MNKNENNFTKGEWHYSPQSHSIWVDDSFVVASFRTDTHERFDPPLYEQQANIKLIAAAPDLLEACELLLQTSYDYYNDRLPHQDDALKESWNIAEKAIAKAKGENR